MNSLVYVVYGVVLWGAIFWSLGRVNKKIAAAIEDSLAV